MTDAAILRELAGHYLATASTQDLQADMARGNAAAPRQSAALVQGCTDISRRFRSTAEQLRGYAAACEAGAAALEAQEAQ